MEHREHISAVRSHESQTSVDNRQESNRERDVEVAWAIASVMNQFIDDGKVTKVQASAVSSEQIDEFMFRVMPNYQMNPKTKRWSLRSNMTAADKRDINRKIARIFSDEDEATRLAKEFGRNELVRIGQEILSEWQDPNIIGVVFYGSRMDPEYGFHEESDIDCVLVSHELHAKDLVEFRRRMTSKGVNSALIHVGGWNLEALKAPRWIAWALDPKKVQFVGRQGDDLDYQQLLIDYITAPEVEEKRRKLMDRIRDRLREAGE